MANPAEPRPDDPPALPTRIPFAGPHPGTVGRDWQSSAEAPVQRPRTTLPRPIGIPRQRGPVPGDIGRGPAIAERPGPGSAAEAAEPADRPAADGPVRSSRSRSRVLVAAVAASALVAGGLWWTHDRSGPETPVAAQLPTAMPTMRITAPGTGASAGVGSGTSSTRSASVAESASAGGPASTGRSPVALRDSAKPAAPAPDDGAVNDSGRNLAAGSRATASSVEGAAWKPANAVDTDITTRWSSQFSDPQWLTVDLGKRWQISEVLLHWENAHATAYRVEVSTDGKTWKRVYSTTEGQGGDVTVQVPKIPARLVRMYGTKRSTDYGYSLLDIEVR
jgi:hypothetical protein